jgi:hypothetical protein
MNRGGGAGRRKRYGAETARSKLPDRDHPYSSQPLGRAGGVLGALDNEAGQPAYDVQGGDAPAARASAVWLYWRARPSRTCRAYAVQAGRPRRRGSRCRFVLEEQQSQPTPVGRPGAASGPGALGPAVAAFMGKRCHEARRRRSGDERGRARRGGRAPRGAAVSPALARARVWAPAACGRLLASGRLRTSFSTSARLRAADRPARASASSACAWRTSTTPPPSWAFSPARLRSRRAGRVGGCGAPSQSPPSSPSWSGLPARAPR